ncbi:unnamed protein product, partial [marine sediment metagenome]
DLVELEVDVLIPASLENTITEKNASNDLRELIKIIKSS